MLKEIYLAYLPNKVLSLRDPRESVGGEWFPFLKDKGSTDVPTTFVCKGFTCLPPVKDGKELRKILA